MDVGFSTNDCPLLVERQDINQRKLDRCGCNGSAQKGYFVIVSIGISHVIHNLNSTLKLVRIALLRVKFFATPGIIYIVGNCYTISLR